VAREERMMTGLIVRAPILPEQDKPTFLNARQRYSNSQPSLLVSDLRRISGIDLDDRSNRRSPCFLGKYWNFERMDREVR
jgi:hypothetical protein